MKNTYICGAWVSYLTDLQHKLCNMYWYLVATVLFSHIYTHNAPLPCSSPDATGCLMQLLKKHFYLSLWESWQTCLTVFFVPFVAF